MNQFDRQILRLRSDIKELKSARMRSASVLATGSTKITARIPVVNYSPQKMPKITITPTSTTAPNMLTSLCLTRWNQRYWRLLRSHEGNSVVYYVWPQDFQQNETIVYEMEVIYTSPATVKLEMVDPIWDY